MPTALTTDPVFSVEVEKDDVAASCPELAWFQARIASHAGKVNRAGHYKISLSRRSDAWQARIQRLEPSRSLASERLLQDRSSACEPLAEAAALTVAILGDDFAERRAQQVAVAPVPDVVKPAPRAAAVSAPLPQQERTRVWVGAGGGAAMSFIAPIAPMLGFGIGIDSTHLRQGLRVMLTTEHKFELDPGRVVVQAWLATMFSCLRFSGRHVGAALCATADAAMLRASAQGFDEGTPSSRPYGDVGLEAQPSWYLSDSYRISAAVAALVPFKRESFSVNGRGVAYVPPPVSWRILLFSEIGAF